jgi:hypothetical protein
MNGRPCGRRQCVEEEPPPPGRHAPSGHHDEEQDRGAAVYMAYTRVQGRGGYIA